MSWRLPVNTSVWENWKGKLINVLLNQSKKKILKKSQSSSNKTRSEEINIFNNKSTGTVQESTYKSDRVIDSSRFFKQTHGNSVVLRWPTSFEFHSKKMFGNRSQNVSTRLRLLTLEDQGSSRIHISQSFVLLGNQRAAMKKLPQTERRGRYCCLSLGLGPRWWAAVAVEAWEQRARTGCG